MRKLLCVLGVCLGVGCSKQGEGAAQAAATPAAAPARRLLVLATTAPMYCFTKNVAGNLADVEMIVPPGVNGAGGFQPSPEEVGKILQANVIIENGFGFESWMDRLVEKNPGLAQVRVIAAKGTGPGIPGLPGDPDSPPAGMPDFSGPPDPHVWLDPFMAIKEVQNIRDALMARDPANADQYLANENEYEAKLRDLDDEVGRETVDIQKRQLACADRTFSYFLSRYEFNIAGAAEGFDASLATKGAGAGVLNKTEAPVVIADPMESGPASTDFYEKTTLANARALREGLMR